MKLEPEVKLDASDVDGKALLMVPSLNAQSRDIA